MQNIDLLSLEDLNFIEESLKHTKLKFEEYHGYPSYEYKQERIKQAVDVLNKVSTIIRANQKA